MMFELILEFLNAIISLITFILLIYVIQMMINKRDLVRSIMFLKGDEFKTPTIVIAFGVMLFTIRETYKGFELLGTEVSEILVEVLETGSVILFFIGILMVVRIFRIKNPQSL